MADRASAIAVLERLGDRLAALLTQPRLGGVFYQWYLEVLEQCAFPDDREISQDLHTTADHRRMGVGIAVSVAKEALP